jgi:hypothetical protein
MVKITTVTVSKYRSIFWRAGVRLGKVSMVKEIKDKTIKN